LKKIVLIDDDRDDAEIFKEALLEVHPSATFYYFDDAKEAVEKFTEQETDLPDFIFLDINMPAYTGWQFLAQFKTINHLKNIPVIVYTTSSREREKEIARELGAAGFITKPTDYKLVKELLAKHTES